MLPAPFRPAVPIAQARAWPRGLLAVGLLAALSGCASTPLGKAAQTATGYASHLMCDDVFISGIDADTAFAERVQPMPGMALVTGSLRYEVDVQRREVTVSLARGFASRAQYRDGLGCMALPAGEPAPAAEPVAASPSVPPLLPAIAGPAVVPPQGALMQAAFGRAMADAAAPPYHRTKAIVVLRDGRLVAEAYAKGYGIDTPVLGFSMTKSVTHALVGILVRQGRLEPGQPAPIAAWRDPADPRHAITVEQLLRQTSGLDLPQDNSGFDITSQTMYTVRDKAGAFAAAPLAAEPGTRWAYTDANYMLLSRTVRDAVGGSAGDVNRFAQAELFGPLGMQSAVFDFDATGTPLGSSHMLASARDWARFGQLYLDDGVVGGQRILPAGWVQAAATPTLATGYGAGFWTNRVRGLVPGWGAPWGLTQAPRDAFFARGFMGQFIVVIPSQRLVIVRLSVSHVRGDDIEETDRLVGEILAAVAAPE